MSKKVTEEKSLVIKTPIGEITLFKGPKYAAEYESLPNDVDQVTPVQMKFEEIGQHITGLYCGFNKQDSSLKKDAVFYFHEIRLVNGVTVGFIGSSQLDRALCALPPYQKDVHIIFTKKKDMGYDRVFKCFQIFVRDHIAFVESDTSLTKDNVPY